MTSAGDPGAALNYIRIKLGKNMCARLGEAAVPSGIVDEFLELMIEL
jgi:hypothetical protein